MGPRSSHPLLGCRWCWRGCFLPRTDKHRPRPSPPANRPSSSPTPPPLGYHHHPSLSIPGQSGESLLSRGPSQPLCYPPQGTAKEGAALRQSQGWWREAGGRVSLAWTRGDQLLILALLLSCQMTLAKSFLSVLQSPHGTQGVGGDESRRASALPR